MNRLLLSAFAALALSATAASAHPPTSANEPLPPGHPPVGSTVSLQGGDQRAWINDSHMHAFFELTKTAFASGPAGVDVDGFEQKSFVIFREFGASHGMKGEAMVDHLKLIPRQVVQIVREDPHVLDSYDNFVAATFGPQ